MPKVSNQLMSSRSILRKPTGFVQLDTARPRGRKGQEKRIKWDPEARDNEYKFRPRSKATIPVKKTRTAASILAAQQASVPQKMDNLGQHPRSPSQGSSRYRTPSPHPISLRAHSSIVLPTATGTRDIGSYQQQQQSHRDSTREQLSTARPSTKTTSTRDPRNFLPTQILEPKRDHKQIGPNFMAKIPGFLKNTESLEEMKAAANKRANHDLEVAAQQKLEKQSFYRPRAPAVPDPPRWSQKPPSAPRPARLPTPDLPEIEGNYFHDIGPDYNNMVGASTWYTNEYTYGTKMNTQLQDARAHIEGMKRLRKK